MLTADIKECADCDSISESIDQIDKEITAISLVRMDNERYELERSVDTSKLEALIMYKRILKIRQRNPDYLGCGCVQLGDIISRVKTLAVSKHRRYPCDSSVGAPLSAYTPCD